MSYWNKNTFCVITGASRGIGRGIAIEFSKNVAPNSVFVLLARDAEQLEETKAEVLKHGIQPVQVITRAIDLAQPNAQDYLEIIKSALKTCGKEAGDFEHSILVHNAASAGDMKLFVTQLEDLIDLREYYDFNLISMILLTSQFVKVFSDSSKQRSIVQISSGVGQSPWKYFGIYGAGKAARDMIMRTISEEEPSISTISYNPGCVDTEMYNGAAKNAGGEDVRQLLESVRPMALTPAQTANRLIKILRDGKHTKGEYVDHSEGE